MKGGWGGGWFEEGGESIECFVGGGILLGGREGGRERGRRGVAAGVVVKGGWGGG